MKKKYKFDIAISFAEEDRNAALALALALEIKGCRKVYYYPDNLHETAGETLSNILPEIYSKWARYAVILLSTNYFKREKEFTKIELLAIEDRIRKEPDTAYVIVVKLEKELSLSEYTFLEGTGYLIWDYNPKRIAQILLRRLGRRKGNKNISKAANVKLSQTIINNRDHVGDSINNISGEFNL